MRLEQLRFLCEVAHQGFSISRAAGALRTTQPNVSKHLRMLQEGGVISRRPEGNVVYYSIADKSVLRLCEAVCGSLREKLAKAQSIFR